jgi:hypothetical protein
MKIDPRDGSLGKKQGRHMTVFYEHGRKNNESQNSDQPKQ